MSRDVDFTAFVRAYTTSLYATAFLLTGDVGDAEDLLQDTWVRLHERWARVEAADAPVAYVRRSLVNLYVSRNRRRTFRPALWAFEPDAAIDDDATSAVANRMVVQGLLCALPARQRAAVVLRYFHDQSDQRIADALGCRPGTVRSLLSRALATMRAVPGEEMVNAGGTVNKAGECR